MCSMGRAGGGARAAPVSATGRRAGGRFDVDRVGGHDMMHRDASSCSRAGPHPPQWPRTTPGGARAGVHLLLRLLPEPRWVRKDRISARVAGQRACFNRPCTARSHMAWAGVGVGMSLEPSSDPGSDYCHVSSMKDGGALANDGRVKPGDKLVRVDGFDCMGVPRAVIKFSALPTLRLCLNFSATGGCSK